MTRFNEQDLSNALEDLATLPYFPQGSAASVGRFLAEAVPGRDALLWLVKGALAHCKVWPGISELRGLLCTKFDALDGIDEPVCNITGYAAYEQEARAIAESDGYKAALPSAEARRLLAPFRGPKDGDV